MFTGIKTFAFISGLLLFSGCAKVVIPHTRDFNETSRGSKSVYLDSYTLTEPFTELGISAAWSSKQIKAAAQSGGISKITYMDEEIFNILFVYQRRRLFIYGN